MGFDFVNVDGATLLFVVWGGISAAFVLLMAACTNACSIKCCLFKRGCSEVKE